MLLRGTPCYNSIMSQIFTKLQTRGRPKKNIDQKLSPVSRRLFSEHCAVFYACCMVYVLEVFLKTKQEKRIGHSEGGFTIYEKLHLIYCFQSFESDIKEWGFQDIILKNQKLSDFAKTINGCAPKFVFKEIIILIVSIHNCIKENHITTIEELETNHHKILQINEAQLNKTFKYIRFTPAALKELKMDKWTNEINKKMKQLWRPFLKIVSYSIFCVQNGIQKNKYLKPFFSDAEHPEETIIGQLNLEQIVEEKQEKEDKNTPAFNLGFTKIMKNATEQQINNDFPIKIEANLSPQSFSDRPLINRRPITLITIPSNHHIEISPTKVQNAERNAKSSSQEDMEIDSFASCNKKIKID